MALNGCPCLLCGAVQGQNLRIQGYAICGHCERRLLSGHLRPEEARGLHRLAVKACLCADVWP